MSLDMHVERRNFFNRIDLNLILFIVALNILGLINLYSATHGVTLSHSTQLFWNQIIWLIIGWSVYIVVTLVDYNIFSRLAWAIYGINVVALLYVMKFGKISYGAQRWIDLGILRYQPSETMKVALVFVLAKILSKTNKPDGLGFRDLVFPTVVVGIPALITIEQPDLGTGLLLIAIFASMVLFMRVKRSIFVFLVVSGLIAMPLMWSFGLKQYQRNRVLTFLTPGKDPRGTGYNSIQSRIAVGSGKFIGKGFRKGTQSQLEFLPERHTDFIFSVLSEEHGFIGSVSTVAFFIGLLFLCTKVASQSRDRFGVLVTLGVTSIIFWHMFVNICMVIGLLPIVGVPLPLLSYGGSMMLTTMTALGIISSVSYRKYLF
jgi:rod shape determining protein RodA